jgi:hypothetical protein
MEIPVQTAQQETPAQTERQDPMAQQAALAETGQREPMGPPEILVQMER